MASRILAFVSLGMLFLFAVMSYVPISEDAASLTTNPFGQVDTYSVDSNWSEEGTLDGLVSDGDILYAEANQEGNWTGFVQDESQSRTISLEAAGDPRDGTVILYINAWENLPNGDAPDNVFSQPLDDFEVEQNFTAEQYNYFNVVVEITETGGSTNQRPHLDSFTLNFLNESNQFGLDSTAFRIFSLFILIGGGLIALIRSI